MGQSSAGDDEFWVLTTEDGRGLLAEASRVTEPRPSDLARWRARASPGRVAAAVRLAEGRRRGASKFRRADRMWFDRKGLEQATAEAVSRHKAARFAPRSGRIFDLCCGIGGDALALAAGSEVVAVDVDATMGRRTLWNAAAYDLAGRVAAIRARAETVEVPRGAWVHVDPDRRAGTAARALRVEDYEPGLAYLLGLAGSAEAGAIKLSPASDFDAHFPAGRFEVELISLGGECKEATAWFGEAVTCGRRATSLPGGATWTDRDGPSGALAATGDVLGHVYDPDPTLLRSGLLDGFAVAHGLTRFAAGVDYLTGDARVDSPFLAAFEVLAVLPLDLKRLRREVLARGLGPLEVKTRGVSLRPEGVRARLRTGGDTPATLLLAGGHTAARAVIALRSRPIS